ncbi:MAG: ABC transporter permease [Spirochaetaceae bacterium]|nr:MAG: ABC transporter permease [Spirochaetaceae bacterium]
MTVFKNYFNRITARPWLIVFTVAIPVLIVLIVSAGGGGNGMRVAFIDRDETFLSGMVRDALDPVAVFIDVEYDDVGTALVEGRIEYALVIPAGMQELVVSGERARVETFSLQGVQMTRSVRSAAHAVLSAAHNVALHVDGDVGAFTSAMARVREGRFALQTEAFRGDHGALSASAAAGLSQLIGMLTLTMLLMTTGSCLLFLKDVEDGTFHRTLAGPISVRRYILETNVAFFFAAALQAVAASLALRLTVPQLTPSALFTIVAILLAFALVAVSFTLAVANTMKTIKRTAIATNCLIMPMVMLGGAFWPFEIMPEYLQRIGAFSPTRWTTSATASALSGAAFVEILPHLGILLLFALVFQMLGSWRRVDVAK